jgi:hypothetical protein
LDRANGFPFVLHYNNDQGGDKEAFFTNLQSEALCPNQILNGQLNPACMQFPSGTAAAPGYNTQTIPPAEDRFLLSFPSMTQLQRANQGAYMFVRIARITLKDVTEADVGTWYVRGAYNNYQGEATAFQILPLKKDGVCPPTLVRHFGPGKLIFRGTGGQENTVAEPTAELCLQDGSWCSFHFRRSIPESFGGSMTPIAHSNAVAIMGPFKGNPGDDLANDRFLVEEMTMHFTVRGDQTNPNDVVCTLEDPNTDISNCPGNIVSSNPCVMSGGSEAGDNEWCKEGLELRVYDKVSTERKTRSGRTRTDYYMRIDQTAYFVPYFQREKDTKLVIRPIVPWPKSPLTLKKNQYLGIVKKTLEP